MNARTLRALAEGRFGELFMIAGRTFVDAFKRGPSNRFEGVPKEQCIQSLRSRAAVSRWVSGSDSSIGGMSTCTVAFEGEDLAEREQEMKAEVAETKGSQVVLGKAPTAEGGGFLKFTGEISLDCAPGKDLFRTGYCATRSPKFDPPLELDAFEGLRLRVRTDGRAYSVNVKVDTIVDEDLYQGFVLVPSSFGDRAAGGEGAEAADVEGSAGAGAGAEAPEVEEDPAWTEVELPFRNLILTYGGSPKVEQRRYVLATASHYAYACAPLVCDAAWIGIQELVLRSFLRLLLLLASQSSFAFSLLHSLPLSLGSSMATRCESDAVR